MCTGNATVIPVLVRAACMERRLLENEALSIEQVDCGKVQISLALDSDKLDYRKLVRSSDIYSILETVLHISAVSVGSEAATLNFCCNIVKYTAAKKLYAACNICHHGRMTLVAEAKVYDENDILFATVLATMFVVDTIKEIPRKW